MSLKKLEWRNLFEAVGLVAIVLSLIFVALQIRQDHKLARSELGAGTTENNADILLIATESEFAKSFAKMINQPDELTDSEMIQIDFFLHAVKTTFIRECYLKERGVFDECAEMIRSRLPLTFGSAYAQTWWRLNWAPHPYIPNWVSDEIAGLDGDTNQQYFQELREGL